MEESTMTDTGIGSLESQEKGSAARKNAGKPTWSSLPLQQVADLMLAMTRTQPAFGLSALTAALGAFQAEGTHYRAFDVLELGTRYLMQATGTNFDGAMCQVIKVWELGEKKYARYNWMKGMPWTETINSAQRHVMHMFNGEQIDKDSGEHHAAHFICNAMMMLHFVQYYPEGNDLPVKWFQ